MAKIPTESGVGEFHVRPGVAPLGSNGWRGVNTEDDPIAIDLNQLQRGQNIRRNGSTLRSRPGLVEKINLSTVAGFPPGAVMWLAEAPVLSEPLNLWVSCQGAFGHSPVTGATIIQIEATADPPAKSYLTILADVNRSLRLASYGTKLISGDGPALREILRVLVFPGPDLSYRIPSSPFMPLANISGFTITCMLEFDGKLFVGLSNNAISTSSKIMVWDGQQLVDDLTGVRPPVAFGIWQNKLVCGFDATAANIRVRDTGSAPGTWTTYALAGSSCAPYGNAIQEYRGKTYIASGGKKIFAFDGTALTLAHTVAAAADGDGVNALTLHNGLLYYGWSGDPNGIPPSPASLGRFDEESSATAWIDSYKDLTGDQTNFQLLGALCSYRGQIHCGGSQQWVVATASNDVKGTLEVINGTGIPAAGYGCLQLVRF